MPILLLIQLSEHWGTSRHLRCVDSCCELCGDHGRCPISLGMAAGQSGSVFGVDNSDIVSCVLHLSYPCIYSGIEGQEYSQDNGTESVPRMDYYRLGCSLRLGAKE